MLTRKIVIGSISGGGQWTRAPPAPPPGVAVGAGVGLGAAGASTRGRRPTAQRHAPAAMQMPHAGISAAAVQALASGWSLPGTLTQAQTQQVLRLAQVGTHDSTCLARFHAAAALSTARAFVVHHEFPHGSLSIHPIGGTVCSSGVASIDILMQAGVNYSTILFLKISKRSSIAFNKASRWDSSCMGATPLVWCAVASSESRQRQ